MSFGDLVCKITSKCIGFVYLSIIYIISVYVLYISGILVNKFGHTVHIGKFPYFICVSV